MNQSDDSDLQGPHLPALQAACQQNSVVAPPDTPAESLQSILDPVAYPNYPFKASYQIDAAADSGGFKDRSR